jgi:hypothetical protein
VTFEGEIGWELDEEEAYMVAWRLLQFRQQLPGNYINVGQYHARAEVLAALTINIIF